MRRAGLSLALAFCTGVVQAEEPAAPTTAELLERMAAMEATIQRLEKEVSTLKTQRASLPPSDLTATLPSTSSRTLAERDFKTTASQLTEPKSTKINLSVGVEADVLVNTGNPGNRYDFVTSSIPVNGQPGHGGGVQSNLGAKASSIDLQIEHDAGYGPVTFHYRNDFFGSGNAAMEYNLKQLYGEWQGLLIGYTTSAIFDRDALPNTLDYEGPNSLLFTYNPQIRYTRQFLKTKDGGLSIIASFEGGPDNISGDAIDSYSRTPDGTVNLRWDQGESHLQAGVLLRSLSAQTDSGRQDAFGWAFSGSAKLALFKADALQLWGSVGEGYAAYIQDTSGLGLDAVVNGSGELQTLPAYAAGAGYLRQWTPGLSSTLSAGYASIDSGGYDELSPFTMGSSVYGSANVIWQVTPQFMAGVEYLYGWREAKNGATGEVSRIQMTLRYSFDDVLNPVNWIAR